MRPEKERTPFGQRLLQARQYAKLTQPQLANRVGMSQSTLAEAEMVGQGSSFTAQIANVCGVRAEWLATGEGSMIANEAREDIPMFSRGPAPPPEGHSITPDDKPGFGQRMRDRLGFGQTSGGTASMQPILSWQHEDDLPPGEFVMIPRLDVHLSAGGGRDQVEIEFIEQQPQAFRADWIRKKHLKPKKLASMTADGRSMEDRIHDGDALVVDTSQTDVIDGKVYALWYEGGERVKRLFRIPGGGLRIHSDNVAHPEIVLGPDHVEHVRIIGRVVHIAGEGGL